MYAIFFMIMKYLQSWNPQYCRGFQIEYLDLTSAMPRTLEKSFSVYFEYDIYLQCQ